MLCNLPPELHYYIADYLFSNRDLNALAQANKRPYSIHNHYLYHRDVLRSHSQALRWAARHGGIGTASHALAAGAEVHSRNWRYSSSFDVAVGNGQLDMV